MSALWSRVASAFVRPAAPAGGLDAVGALDGGAEGAGWAPPIAPPAADGAAPTHTDPAVAATQVSCARRVAGATSAPCTYAVLAAPALARPLGAATALAAGSGAAALMSAWGTTRPRHGMSVPVARPARRLAASLATRGLDVRTSGRLVEVWLGEDEDTAVDDLRRAEAAATAIGAASVVVLAAARGEAWDGVLATRDAVLVHGDDDAIIDLALGQLGTIGASAHRLDHAPSRLVLALAIAGVRAWGAAAPLCAAVEVSS